MVRSIAEAYLKGDARAFFDAHPSDVQARARLVERVSRPVSAAVAQELVAQNARYAPSAARDRHIAQLEKGAAAVVTGQQVGLFLGPLYTLYKAASAVRDARALAEETKRPVVPVFWLQTEDHDLPEVASCGTPSSTLRLPASTSERVSLEHVPLPAAVDVSLRELEELLASLPHGKAHVAWLRKHYRAGAGWSEAFAGAIAELFAEEGLVLLNPRSERLAREAAAIHRRALGDANAIGERLTARCDELTAAGFSPPIHIRGACTLTFFHPEGPRGPRYRLEPLPGNFRELGGSGRTHATEALLSRLEEEPLAFSTSALLRPILQDTLLPTAVYVGGPGELSYFAQLGPLYALFGLTMPLIAPRARFVLIEPEVSRTLSERGLTAQQVMTSSEDELVLRLAPPSEDGSIERLATAFDEALEALVSRIESESPRLSTPARKTRSSARRAVAKLRRKHVLATGKQAAPVIGALTRSLSPHGLPQERVHGLSHYAALIGERALARRVLDAVVPFDGQLRELSL